MSSISVVSEHWHYVPIPLTEDKRLFVSQYYNKNVMEIIYTTLKTPVNHNYFLSDIWNKLLAWLIPESYHTAAYYTSAGPCFSYCTWMEKIWNKSGYFTSSKLALISFLAVLNNSRHFKVTPKHEVGFWYKWLLSLQLSIEKYRYEYDWR